MHHVLIVEDEPALGRVLQRWVESEGLSAATATGAEQALLLASEQSPAVALCDVHLRGGRNGFWLAEQLRLLNPHTAVVMTTALHEFEAAVAALQAGATDYVVKPVTRERLREALQRALAEHESRHASASTGPGEEAPAGPREGARRTTAALLTVLRAQGGTAVHHAQRVSRVAVALARALNVEEMEVFHVEHAALLRDVQRSDIHGIVRALPHLVAPGAIAVASQERFDGTGFPLGLQGDAIPRGARIVAVADAYDEVVTGRGLTGLTPAHAVEALCGERAREFDPDVLRALRAVQPALQTSAA